MFESRLQIAQLCLAVAAVFAVVAALVLMFGPLPVGIACLLMEHAVAAVGCAFYAESKGYSPLIGIPIGVGLGVMGAVAILVLPDEAPDDEMERYHRLSQEGVRNARNRDPGYEVLDDEDD
jgi:hypothetical protein